MTEMKACPEIRQVLAIYGIDNPPAGLVGALAFLHILPAVALIDWIAVTIAEAIREEDSDRISLMADASTIGEPAARLIIGHLIELGWQPPTSPVRPLQPDA